MPTAEYEPSAEMKKRLVLWILGPLFAVAGGLIVGLSNLTVNQHQKYAEMANNTHFTNRSITASRGTIYDAKGAPLAWSATVYKVFIDPTQYRKDMEAIEKTMEKRRKLQEAGELPEGKRVATREEIENEVVEILTTKLEIPKKDVLNAMEKDSQYVVLKTQVDKSVADELTAYFDTLGMESVSTEQDSKRYYPQNDMAAQVIGFTNTDGNGQYGLEYYYNDYLSGVNGRSVSAKDAQGNSMPYRHASIYPAQDGASIYLTLDTTLQYCLEKNLKKMSDSSGIANRSCGIIMNAKTGAVYAMATYPSFDLNNPSVIADPKVEAKLKELPEEEYQEAYITAREQQWKNKAISEVYVPGSVFKIFTAAAAIEEKAVDWETYGYYCSGEYRISGAEPIHCHNRNGHGTLSFQGALTQSCNPAFIDIGRRLGIHKFCTYFSSFGLTEKTGIDLPGETSSIYREEDDMSFVDLATSSFGQSNVLTPMEMITGIAATVNGGYLVQPHVVDKIVSSDGNIVKTFGTNVRRQVISEETSQVMRTLLQGVVDGKEGANAHIDGYKIGGKSGTAQSVVNGRVSEDRYVASYTCFAPANDPEIIMLVIADTPTIGSYYGSYVAAPCARDIMEEALPYLGFYPEYTEEQAARLNVTIPRLLDKDVEAAKATLDELKLNYKIVGEGETIVAQCPETGLSVSAGGSVVLYTEKTKPEKVEVPDLKGYTASDANEKLTNLGLNYISVGANSGDSGVLVEHQSIEPGTEVEVGTVITLTYLVNSQSG